MAAEWYCRLSGEEHGPLSGSQLRIMVAEGRLSGGDAVRQGQSGVWVPAASVKGLFDSSAEALGGAHPSAAVTESTPGMRSRPLLRAVPMEDEPAGAAASPARARLLDKDDAGLDLASMPSGLSSQPPKPTKGWRSTGLDFLAEERSTAAGGAAVRPALVGSRFQDAAEPIRRWTLPALVGTLTLLLVAWMIVGQLRRLGTSGGPADGALVGSSNAAPSGGALAQNAAGKGPIGPPPPPKAGAAAGVQEPAGVTWVDASHEAWKCGDVTVKILAAAIGRAKTVDAAKRVADTQDAYLLVAVELANHSTTRKVQYRSWNHRDDPPRLTDDLKNPYALQIAPGGGAFEGQQRVKSIYPEKAVEDLLVFERPVERARTLRLQLPASAFEGSGIGYLEIPRSMVKSESGPSFRPPPQPPAVKSKAPAPGGEKKGHASTKGPAKTPGAAMTGEAALPSPTGTPETDFGIKPDEAQPNAAASVPKPGPPPVPQIKTPPPVPKAKAS